MRTTVYSDRREAGRVLGRLLAEHPPQAAVVVALPRGGVPVAAEVAAALGAPLDVVVVRKIGAPGRPELGVGAVGEDGVPVWDDEGLRALGLVPADLSDTVAAERAAVRHRVVRYRRGATATPLAGRTAVVIDDGVATGGTALAALRLVRGAGAAGVVLAVPVAAPAALRRLRGAADAIVCPRTPRDFRAVGEWYARFDQTTDEEVEALLAAARRPQ